MSSRAPASGRKASSKEVWEQDRRHHVHPYHNFVSYDQHGSLIIEEGHGAYLKDIDGKEYFDAVGGMWCTNIGLGRQEMVDAIAEQAAKLAYANPFTDMSNQPAAKLSAKLAELAPGDLNHVLFTGGGSTANDSAFRLIQMYQGARGKPGKKHILSRHDAYHGTTYLTASLSGKAGDRMPDFSYIEDIIHHLTSPNFYRAPAGLDEAQFCDYLVDEMEHKILELGADNVAAFFAEPVLGSGGVIVPPEGYNRRTWELCQKYDIVYVADEVVTGFGRLGHWFVSKDMFDVQPDIICCAKGLTSAYLPLGAMIFSDRMYQVLSNDPDRWFTGGYTYSGHPVCCAAALKNIEILEREKIFDNVKEVGAYFEEQLHTLLDLPIVGDIRGRLFMMCVVNVMNKKTKEFFPPEVNIGKRISSHAEEQGVIVRPAADLNIMSPALTMSKKDVDYILPRLRKAIELTMADLKAEGYLPA
ncbi:MAG: aminotransferase [Gammaproteobacteria bacterium]|nr:aminotransferase [Gammaproteobacteria bacterium]